MAGLKFAFLLGLMALFILMEQTKPVAGRRGLKKLRARVDDLEARLEAIEECKPCEKPPFGFLFPKKGTSDYIEGGTFNKNLIAVTACLWLKTAEGVGSFISYATSQTDNEFLVFTAENGQLKVIVDGKYHGSTVTINDNEWHHVCVTLGDNAFKVYVDGANRSSQSLPPFTINEGGKVIIGQDQDSLGGGFTHRDSFKGEMTGINVWDHVLIDADISKLAESCSAGQGNIISMADLGEDKIRGDVEMIRCDCEPLSD